MKGYMIVTYRTTADADTMKAYAGFALPAIMEQGGRFIVRAAGDTVDARESGLTERTVVIEFPSKEQALAAYESEAYQSALAVMAGKAERDVRFAEGTD